MTMGNEQLQRLMTLLSKLDASDSGDPNALADLNRRVNAFEMLDFGGQEHTDAKTLESMGWIRSRHFGTNLSNSWYGEGIYALDLTEDGKAALEEWRVSTRENERSNESRRNQRQQSRPQIMLVHGSKDGQVPAIVDQIRLWCFDNGMDAYKAADRPNVGRFVLDKVNIAMEEADYYIVVLTADEELKDGTFRPRPNPMIEMGRLLATNPSQVCVLKERKVEMPSDYAGLVTEPLDDWKSVLMRELRNAGLM